MRFLQRSRSVWAGVLLTLAVLPATGFPAEARGLRSKGLSVGRTFSHAVRATVVDATAAGQIRALARAGRVAAVVQPGSPPAGPTEPSGHSNPLTVKRWRRSSTGWPVNRPPWPHRRHRLPTAPAGASSTRKSPGSNQPGSPPDTTTAPTGPTNRSIGTPWRPSCTAMTLNSSLKPSRARASSCRAIRAAVARLPAISWSHPLPVSPRQAEFGVRETITGRGHRSCRRGVPNSPEQETWLCLRLQFTTGDRLRTLRYAYLSGG